MAWSKSAGAEGLQSFPLLLCGTRGTAKGSVSLHAGVSGGSPLLDVGTWSCLWERRNRKAQAASGDKVAETDSSNTFCKETGLDEKDSVVSLLLCSQAGTERPELGITPGRGGPGGAVHMGLDFPPGSAYLAAPGFRSLAPDQAVAPGAGRAGCLPPGLLRAWDRLLARQAAVPEELLFPDRKIKIPGENMPILQKELFLVKGFSDQPQLRF